VWFCSNVIPLYASTQSPPCVSVCSYNQMRDNHLVCESAVAGEAAGIGMGLVMLGSADGPALTEMTNYARETQHEKIIRGLALGVALVMCVMYLRPPPSSLLPPTIITTAPTATASFAQSPSSCVSLAIDRCAHARVAVAAIAHITTFHNQLCYLFSCSTTVTIAAVTATPATATADLVSGSTISPVCLSVPT
jgi:hypothetical protein